MLDLILIVVVLLLIFGGGKLREAGSDLGAVVKRARRKISGSARTTPPLAETQPDAEFPEVLAARQQSRRGGHRG